MKRGGQRWSLPAHCAPRAAIPDSCSPLVFCPPSLQERGRTALHDAVAHQHAEVVQLLLSRHAPADALDGSGWTPLLYAATLRNLALCRQFIDRNDVDYDAQPDDGVSSAALHVACATDHRELVEDLVAAGANVNIKDALGRTPLHRACRASAGACVQMLVNGGADVNARSAKGWTPLMYASRWGAVQAAAVLLKAGADVSVADHSGANAIVLAHEASMGEYMRDGDGDAAIGYGPSPAAVKQGAKHVYDLLAQHGAGDTMAGGVMGALLDVLGVLSCSAAGFAAAEESAEADGGGAGAAGAPVIVTDTPSAGNSGAAGQAAVDTGMQQHQQEEEEEEEPQQHVYTREEAAAVAAERAANRLAGGPGGTEISEIDPSDFSFDQLPNVPLTAAKEQQPVTAQGADDDWSNATSSASELFTTLVSGGPVASAGGEDEFAEAASDAQALMSAVLGGPVERQ